MPNDIVLNILPNGDIEGLHDDALIDLQESFNDVTIKRASNVEPDEHSSLWRVDFVHDENKVDNESGFATRGEALQYEVGVLQRRMSVFPGEIRNKLKGNEE